MPLMPKPRHHPFVRQRHRGEMASGRPPRNHDPLLVAAKRGQLPKQKIDAGMNFRNNLVKRRLVCKRVADQRDINAVRQRSFGE
jgi:hypothetical protein